jgi:hypothetical protein
MSSAERPEADVAEQSRSVLDDEQPSIDHGPGADLDAEISDVLEQMQEAGLPDEDEAPYGG